MIENEKLGETAAFASACANNESHHIELGMSKRFYAACAALNGLLANNEAILSHYNGMKILGNIDDITGYVCRASYQFADELLKQENKQQ